MLMQGSRVIDRQAEVAARLLLLLHFRHQYSLSNVMKLHLRGPETSQLHLSPHCQEGRWFTVQIRQSAAGYFI